MARRRLSAGLVAAVILVPALAWADGSAGETWDRVKVHLTGDPALALERRIEGTNLWESLCVGTCDMQVPLGGTYRVSGRGVRPSLPIALVPAKNVLTLDTKPAYSAAFGGGITLVIVGSLAIFGGAIAATVGTTSRADPPCGFDFPCSPQPTNDAAVIGGVLSMLTGALVITAGALAISLGDHTRTRDTVALSPTGLTVKF